VLPAMSLGQDMLRRVEEASGHLKVVLIFGPVPLRLVQKLDLRRQDRDASVGRPGSNSRSWMRPLSTSPPKHFTP
jgi:hypothetical protein